MRVPSPRRPTNNGMWGGFGSKAPQKAWRPAVTSTDGTEPPPAPVHRRLRLRKLGIRKMLRRQGPPTIFDWVLAGLVVLAGFVMLMAFVVRLME